MITCKYLVLTGTLSLLAGCNPATSNAPAVASTSNSTTSTVVAKRQDITGYKFFDGTLVIPSIAQATAFSPYDTPILTVMTSPGKYVDRGDPIVKLTIPGADQATNQAKTNSTLANDALSDQKSLNSGPVKTAQQALKNAQDAEKAAQDTVAAGGTADVQAATQTRTDAEAALRAAQQQFQQNLEPAKQNAAASAAQLEQTKLDAAQGLVRAPISGTIVTLAAQPGMDAKSGGELATIVNFNSVRIQAVIPPELKGIIVKGSRVIVAMAGPSSEPMDGRVLSVKVSPPAAGAQSQGYLAEIEFTNSRSMVQPSTTVRRVGIKTGVAKNVVVIPVSAVVSQGGTSTVKVQKGPDWISRSVETGLSDGNLIEIKSGLAEGDIVQVTANP